MNTDEQDKRERAWAKAEKAICAAMDKCHEETGWYVKEIEIRPGKKHRIEGVTFASKLDTGYVTLREGRPIHL